MKLPAKVNYALRATLELAARYKGEVPISIEIISKAQKIPKNFLTQLLIRLKSADIVVSHRGVSGGYFLKRHPSQINVADVVKAIDDAIIGSVNQPKASGRIDANKLISEIWEDVNRAARKRLEELSLESLALKLRNEQMNYYI